ncbi:MAG: ABC transporter ATP-binding protein [Clostridia bacterium]|nr:ABC transporter ATP-binding protein [Clostridia bacterium]
MELLRFDDVSFRYHSLNGETLAVSHLSFSVKVGEFVAIVGPSGCGKTTILSLIAGLLSPSEGKIHRADEKYGYMLQRDELFPWRTVLKNILLPLEIERKLTKENREHCISLANKYGLKDFLDKYPDQLSGGLRQRAALIRTLSTRPDLLLLDEPFSALDYQTRLNVCEDVSSIIREEKKTAVLITHDLSEGISVADKILVLTARPASLKAEHVVPFTERSPLKRRNLQEFPHLFDLLWRELNE